MTADEFRKLLDRLHVAMSSNKWSNDLYVIWCALNRQCDLMEDAERVALERPLDTAVQPTRSLPAPPKRSPWSDHTAEQIGKLQARVSQLEGDVKALRAVHEPVFQVDPPARGHEDSGGRCCAGHVGWYGACRPPCIQCKRCGEWIRPEAMGQECPGKQPIEGDGWSDESPPGDDAAASER